ncbi:MAG: Gldg family protein [Spirochaetota bacterium]|nr:Gldg family protein [Spirochaetota bacterium]
MKLKEIAKKLIERNAIFLNLSIIVLINLVGLTLYFRIDLTENHAYSLSDVSKDLVSNLEDPLNIKVFFSKDLPSPYNSVYRYLSDLLEEYSQYGNKNFRYEIVDVEKHKDVASDFGIFTAQIREIKDDQIKFRNAYMGLAIVHGDMIEKIASITEPTGIEYRITTLINKITGKIDSLLKLENPINITLYASSNLPVSGMENLNEKVSEIIKKCNVHNYNKLQYRYIDPYADNSAMDAADIYGIIKLNWPSFKSMEGKTIKSGEGFVGIVVEKGEKFETIQLLSRTIFGQYMVGELKTLEDRINNAVDNIISINPKIGYITGHDEKKLNNREEALYLKNLLSDMYELKPIDLTKEDIPEHLNTLIINGPKKKLSDEELFKVDQFIMNGKSVLFLLDSFNEVNPGMGNMLQRGPVILPLNTGLEKLVAHYGITVNKDIVLDKKCYRAIQGGFGGQEIYFAPIIDVDGLNMDNLITRFIKTIVIPKASSLSVDKTKLEKLGIKAIELVSSSEKSWLMKGRINYAPWGMSPPNESNMSKYNLSTLLTGEFESYFKDKEIPIKKENKKAKETPIKSTEYLIKSKKPARLIVVGTSEVAASTVVDKDGRSPNAVFIHNMIDYLSGNYNIPEMRSKGLEINPLQDTDETFKLLIKLFNIAGLPFIIIIIGLVIWRRRISRKNKIMEEFGNHE